jgi:hypothetical protein
MTPTNAPLIQTDTIPEHFYMFRHHKCHPQGIPHQDLKLTKIYY